MAETTEKSSLASRIGVVLAALTLLASAVNAIPAFIALKGKEAYVAYEIDNTKMVYPPGSDRQAILKLLTEKRIPDSFGSILLSNRGDVAAKEVAVTVSVPGVIVAESTDPNPESKAAWVTIMKDFDLSKDSSRIKYILRDVGLNRNLKINVSYISEPYGDVNWEVFYDGKPGIRSTSLATVPENARAISFRPALVILGVGLAISLLSYVLVRVRSSQLIRALLFGGIRIRNGRFEFVSRMQHSQWRSYKSKIVFELAKLKSASLQSTVEGNFDSVRPEEFWDALILLNGQKVALEIHTSNQNFFSTPEMKMDYALRLTSMAINTADLVAVAVINDEDCWSSDNANDVPALVSTVNHSTISFLFLFGDAKQVATDLSNAVPASTHEAHSHP